MQASCFLALSPAEAGGERRGRGKRGLRWGKGGGRTGGSSYISLCGREAGKGWGEYRGGDSPSLRSVGVRKCYMT
jgi:hypothetical protein